MIGKIHKPVIELRLVFICFMNSAFQVIWNEYTRHTAKKMESVFGGAYKNVTLLGRNCLHVCKLAVSEDRNIYFCLRYFPAGWINNWNRFTGIINKKLSLLHFIVVIFTWHTRAIKSGTTGTQKRGS